MIYLKKCINKHLAFITLMILFASEGLVIKNKSEAINKNTRITTIILNDIQSQLNSIHQQLKQPSEKIDLTSLNQELDMLTTKIDQLKVNGETQINQYQLLTNNRNEVEKQLENIHQVVNSIDKKQNPIHYLPISALPFQLISIDNIQHVNLINVSYDYKTVPLEKGDSLAGWHVLHIDFGKQCVEFENKNKEHVVVKLDESGEQHG
ncbi:hypothetical protein [Legionella gresilensis]|uniref:hypothetical protein n=1 Tax=Legionella gresilensis TaxID=91823 RepID=UPI0010413C0B|nr:hypothetical protein [Legionella gresilensis]